MEFKFSPVHDDQMESGVNGLPSIALGKRDRQDLSSAVALLENTIMPLSGGDIPLQFKSAEWLESDNYQVALVPLGNKADREGADRLVAEFVYAHGGDTAPRKDARASVRVDQGPPRGLILLAVALGLLAEPALDVLISGETRFEDLPVNARNYLKRIEQACGVPIDMISTGPDRDETIVLRHPFDG